MKTEREYYVHPLSKGQERRYGIRKPQLPYELAFLGRVKNCEEIRESNWLLGCETLDRDYADYDAYREYLKPLGIRYLRFQGGWAKTEKIKGHYNWEWMDHIVEDAVERGFAPWIQTGYGNPLYPRAGGENLGAGMPLSETGQAAYEKWVRAMVERYCSRVRDWEVWNEPNFGDNTVNTPETAAEFNFRTAAIIREIQPDARISALALGHIDLEYAERFFRYLNEKNGCGLFHNVTYHDYVYNPDSNQLQVFRLRQIVEKYAPGLILRQGENGAPSERNAGGALADFDWTETAQAKWDLRRMLENLGNDIQCSVFSIAEMQYRGNGPIQKKNTKGLLETDTENRVIRPKTAYYAVQNTTAVFDDTLERLRGVGFTHNISCADGDQYWVNTDRSIAVYGYRKKGSEKRIYTIWNPEGIPKDSSEFIKRELVFHNSDFEEPVLVDLLTGNVYEIDEKNWKKEGKQDRFFEIPVYDSPILLAEKCLIPVEN